MKGNILSRILLAVLLAGLLSGVTWLIHLQFESGDAYPAGSSMRADPLGSKALYETCRALPGTQVARNFQPFAEIEDISSDSVLLMLNMRGRSMHRLAHYDAIERYVSGGGRLVIALNPNGVGYKHLDQEGEFIDKENASDDEVDVTEVDVTEEDLETEEDAERSPFARRAMADEERFWGELALMHGEHEGGDAVLSASDSLPAQLPWREGGVLAELSEEWRPVYQIGDEVVVAERSLGRGSIVVTTDDYLFSNEALMKHRQPQWLLWALGGKRSVIFDETHLGVADSTGVAILMRRYHLGGFFFAFAFLVALVVWRGASPLLPPHVGRTKGNVVLTEHSTEAGLSDLVRRSVPSSELPLEAFRQWKKSFIRNAADERYYANEVAEAETLLAEYEGTATRKRKPLEIHLKIQTIMNRKKRKQL